MKMTVFEVPIFKYTIPNWIERKVTLMEALPKEGYTDFFANKMNGLPPYIDVLGETIMECMQEFANNYPCPVMITSAWCERAKKYDMHGAHNHGATGFSAILYVDFDQFEHDATKFWSPFTDPATGDLMEYQPIVKEGDLVIFPSFMVHEGPMNKSDKERIIVSFNIMGEDVMKAYYNGLNNKPLTRQEEIAQTENGV
jgi:hypothetical protein